MCQCSLLLGTILSFGQCGKKEGDFNMPNHLCIDKDDFIFVTDYYNHRVQIFCLGTADIQA